MMIHKLIGGLLFAVLLLTSMVTASGQKTKSSETSVTTIVHDYDAIGNEVLTRSDDHNGTGEASYSPNDTNVMSFIDSNGEWFLNLYGQTVRQPVIRQLFVTPNDVYSSTTTSVPPAGFYWQSVEVSSVCRNESGSTVPFSNITTSNGNCSLDLDFGYEGVVYKLLESPVLRNATDPATSLVTVTCNSVSGGECVGWTIAPNTGAGAPNPTVANLYSYTGGAKHPWVFIGQYYNTFRIDVTNP